MRPQTWRTRAKLENRGYGYLTKASMFFVYNVPEGPLVSDSRCCGILITPWYGLQLTFGFIMYEYTTTLALGATRLVLATWLL